MGQGSESIPRLRTMRNSSERFGRYLQRWWEGQLQGEVTAGSWQHGRGVEELASEFRRDTQFELIQARFLLRRPNVDSARALVHDLVPQPQDDDVDLLTTAVVRAGVTARRVRATGAVGASLTVCALVLRNVLRRR
jgi:hypothetical protein